MVTKSGLYRNNISKFKSLFLFVIKSETRGTVGVTCKNENLLKKRFEGFFAESFKKNCCEGLKSNFLEKKIILIN